MTQFIAARSQQLKVVSPYVLALFGGFLYAFGVNSLLVANGLSEGGFAGLSTLLHYLFGTSVGVMYFVINIPLLIVAARILGRSFLWKTLTGIVIITTLLLITARIQVEVDQKLLACLYAGAMSGLGRGAMFRSGFTTGGVDIIAFILHKYLRFPRAYTILTFDIAVMVLFACFINIETAMYSLVALYIGSHFLHKLTKDTQ